MVVAWFVLGLFALLVLVLLAYGLRSEPATSSPPSGQRDIQARDGTWVASKGELSIANWLHARGLAYRYEPELAGGLTPDFHLQGSDVLIEYWGMAGDPGYEERMEEKMGTYEEHGYDVVGLFPTHLHEMDEVLERELGKRGIAVG